MKKIVVLFLVIYSIVSCTQEEIGTREYPRVRTYPVEDIIESGVTFKGEVFNAREKILDHGFIWSANQSVDLVNSEKIELGPYSGIGHFQCDVDRAIAYGVKYFVRSYVKTANYTVYGEIVEFDGIGSNEPIIFDFTPKEGANGSIITIDGDYFSNLISGNIVLFGDLQAEVQSANPKKLIVKLPDQFDKTGFVKISVSVQGQVGNSTSNFLLSGVRIDGVSPKSAVIAKTQITISGSNFGIDKSKVQVFFDDKECEIDELAEGIIKLKLPPDAKSGKYKLKIVKDNKVGYSPEEVESITPWKKISDCPINGYATKGGFFIINDKAYFLINVDNSNPYLMRYDITLNRWERMADLPIALQFNYMVGFAINGMGYIAGGLLGSSNSIWSFIYDPTTNLWTQVIDDFQVEGAYGFSLNNIGYGLLGRSQINLSHNFKIFNPESNLWSLGNILENVEVKNPFGFIIGDDVYVGLGETFYGSWNDKTWKYNIITGKWTQLAKFPGSLRTLPFSFSISNKGYVGGVFSPSIPIRDFWEYNPLNELWLRRADVPSTAPLGNSNGFSYSEKGYVATSLNSTNSIFSIWMYDPSLGD